MSYNSFRAFNNPFTQDDIAYCYEKIYLIRYFEETILELFSQGKLNGTTHAYIGQEANAVAISSSITYDDIIFSSHRCHGHFLSYTNNPKGLMAEMMGHESGVCGGRGGSQHLHFDNFYSNGVQGGIVANSVGAALAEKKNKSGNITIVFLGDGTLGEGIVYESLNIASLWKVPILFILENNYYAQSTPSKLQIAGSILKRAEAFSIKTDECTSNDVRQLYPIVKNAVDYVRNEIKPMFVLLNTFRLCHHSKNDDNRPNDEIEKWMEKDPILLGEELVMKQKESIEKNIKNRINKIVDNLISN
jgi:2-oxoisovalerate dehydrogenase E1 component|tara:strand:+ start:447 stop:1355 length:909 start_codon:yes stop_codon:yes gene_type:complete